MGTVKQQNVRKLIGKPVYAVKKDGGVVKGKLVRMHGNKLFVEIPGAKGKQVKTKAIVPLVLFDLLAIGTAPYAGLYGGYPGVGYPGIGYPGAGYPFFY
ncbi:hypothetical protein AB6A23_20325 [Paenibacillus tarimensis]